MTTLELIEKTKAAWGSPRDTDTDARNRILTEMAACLEADSAAILEQNRADMADARGHISDVMLDRLRRASGRQPRCRTMWGASCRNFTMPTA